ncbi:CD209 antigen-like protein E [Polypterus senegalus]|nr:CD209 antigen-like protein E [Polypterus senegalus]
MNKKHNRLQSQYEGMNKTYTSLQFKYKQLNMKHTSLQTKYEQLNDRATALDKSCLLRDTSAQGQTCPLCPESWLLFNSKCYFFSTNKMNWISSRDNCISFGGHLVIIEGMEKQNFLKALVEIKEDADKSYWIGLTDVVKEGHFIWVDNKPLDPKKGFWSKGEPNNWTHEQHTPSGEDCVYLQKSKQYSGWYDGNCKVLKKRICEAAPARCPAQERRMNGSI